MIVKFHARGAGRGSGPVEYLLGKEFDRDGAKLDRGNPAEIQDLINSSPYAKKYTSGVLSFEEKNLDQKTKDKLMSSFEKTLLPGLKPDQYSCLWVEHLDKGRLELNFVVPNIELTTGKRLQPYFDKADKPRVNAWKLGMNASLKLHDPDDPINKRELVTSNNLPRSKQEAARAITDGLLTLAGNGELKNRKDVIRALEGSGFNVARQTKSSISIANPEGGQNIRLKGMIYEQDFKFSSGLREEIEAASTRYREKSEERIREARKIYSRGIEIKRKENKKRYKRAEPTNEHVSSQDMVMGSTDRDNRSRSFIRGDMGSREDDQRQLAGDTTARERNGENSSRDLGGETLREQERTIHSSPQRPENSRRVVSQRRRVRLDKTGEKIDDGTRKSTLERIREFTATTREATQRLSDSLRQFNSNVRNYLERERSFEKQLRELKLSSNHVKQRTDEISSLVQRNIKNERGMNA